MCFFTIDLLKKGWVALCGFNSLLFSLAFSLLFYDRARLRDMTSRYPPEMKHIGNIVL